MTNIDNRTATGSVLQRGTREHLRCLLPRQPLCCCGIGSNAQSFTGVMDALPRSLEIIAWNAPGYSGSQPLTELRPSPADYAARLADLLDDLGISRVVLTGHSLDALFAVSFAARYPQRVSAIALLPTLVAVGREDVVTPPSNARAVFAKLSTLFEFHEIEQASHASAPGAAAQRIKAACSSR